MYYNMNCDYPQKLHVTPHSLLNSGQLTQWFFAKSGSLFPFLSLQRSPKYHAHSGSSCPHFPHEQFSSCHQIYNILNYQKHFINHYKLETLQKNWILTLQTQLTSTDAFLFSSWNITKFTIGALMRFCASSYYDKRQIILNIRYWSNFMHSRAGKTKWIFFSLPSTSFSFSSFNFFK